MFEIMPFDRRSYSVSNYNPFRELQEMEKRFWGDSVSNSFRTDITETNDAYKLEADLPGFKKEDINIELDDTYLTIQAERKSETEEKDKTGSYVRRERSCGSFSRSFDVSGIDVSAIKASYQDGVLKLVLPKKEEIAPAARRLEIE